MARILIAEDTESVREYCARALTLAGYQVTAVADGVAALEALSTERFDLLLTDIAMPELDGIALALKVAKDWPGTAILLMTGFAAERQRAHNLDALVHEVLTKPFEMYQLLESIAAALKSLQDLGAALTKNQ